MVDSLDSCVTLYFLPSPVGIDWRSPAHLSMSAIRNVAHDALFQHRHPIGHVNIEIYDRASQRHVLTGMTAARKRDRFKILFREQLGLGVLFHFFDGHIERPKQIERDLARRFEVGQISFLRIRLRPESIQRLIRFHDEFVSDGKPKYYGFPVRPRYREGGGCSEYAASYLEVGGVLLNEFCQAWQKTVLVPEPLIGGPASNRRVSMREILLSRHARQWASDINKHRPLTFWDPDLMHQWVERVWQSGGAGQYESLHFSCVKMQSARGLEIDLTHLPTPIEPLWLDARDLIKDETLGTS